MSQFTKPFIGELVGHNLWKVHEPFEYHVGCYPSNEIIKVPVGFVTNFASVPRIFWPFIYPVDTHAKSAVIHDFCYYTSYHSKKHSDFIFKEALTVLQIEPWKIFVMYWSVRLFGHCAWNRHKKRNLLKNTEK